MEPLVACGLCANTADVDIRTRSLLVAAAVFQDVACGRSEPLARLCFDVGQKVSLGSFGRGILG